MEHLTSLINSYFHEPHASLLNGILLGRQLYVTDTFYNQLKEVGLIHIVVLSGMNITMLSAIVMNTLVGYIGRVWATIITITIIIGFVLFVGAEAPVIRAATMAIISLAALLYGRKTLALYSLFLSGLLMVLINQDWLTSISFQLSFGATLGIILFGTGDTSSSNHNGIVRYLAEELRISLAAQVFTLPLIFWYFRQISLVSPVANILVAWLIAPIMVLGMVLLALGAISWHVGFVFSWVIYPLLHIIVLVVEILSKFPWASIQL